MLRCTGQGDGYAAAGYLIEKPVALPFTLGKGAVLSGEGQIVSGQGKDDAFTVFVLLARCCTEYDCH